MVIDNSERPYKQIAQSINGEKDIFSKNIWQKIKSDYGKKSLKEKVEQILKDLEKAYEKMVIFKKAKGSPLVVSENGKIIKIPASQIPPTAIYMR